jgi:hypothetical protein
MKAGSVRGVDPFAPNPWCEHMFEERICAPFPSMFSILERDCILKCHRFCQDKLRTTMRFPLIRKSRPKMGLNSLRKWIYFDGIIGNASYLKPARFAA